MKASTASASMMMEPVLQENGNTSVPLYTPENRGASMASLGGSTVDEFPGLDAVSSQSTTTYDSNNTSPSVWSSPLETSGGYFEQVPPLKDPVVETFHVGRKEAFSSQSSTANSSPARSSILDESEKTFTPAPPMEKPILTTSHVGRTEAVSSQSSTADSSKSTTSPAGSSVLKQSERTFTPAPPMEKPTITTSHVGRKEAVSSQSFPVDSSESTTFPTWSSVVKQSARPSALAVSPSAKHAIATSTSLESSGRPSAPVLPSTKPANMTSQVAHNGGPSQSSTADISTITSSSARSTSLERDRRPSTPFPPNVKPATMTFPVAPPSEAAAVPSSHSDNDFRKVPKGVYVVCDDFLWKNLKRPASIYEKTKACKGCENRSRLKYAVWSDNSKQWQLIRPYPAERVSTNVAFKECAHYASNIPCPKNPCSFPHGQLELTMWTMEREGGKLNKTKIGPLTSTITQKGVWEERVMWSCELELRM